MYARTAAAVRWGGGWCIILLCIGPRCIMYYTVYVFIMYIICILYSLTLVSGRHAPHPSRDLATGNGAGARVLSRTSLLRAGEVRSAHSRRSAGTRAGAPPRRLVAEGKGFCSNFTPLVGWCERFGVWTTFQRQCSRSVRVPHALFAYASARVLETA